MNWKWRFTGCQTALPYPCGLQSPGGGNRADAATRKLHVTTSELACISTKLAKCDMSHVNATWHSRATFEQITAFTVLSWGEYDYRATSYAMNGVIAAGCGGLEGCYCSPTCLFEVATEELQSVWATWARRSAPITPALMAPKLNCGRMDGLLPSPWWLCRAVS